MAQAPHVRKVRHKQIRLRYFDYGNTGAYYVTICTYNRKRFLSTIKDKKINLTWFGVIVEEELQRTISMRENLSLGQYVIMPNHVHMILFFHDRTAETLSALGNDSLRKFGGSHSGSLSSIIGNFKSAVTSRIRKTSGHPEAVIWQKSFYEHVIRDDKDLVRISDYIMTNPITWEYDEENPCRIRGASRDGSLQEIPVD